MDWKLHSERYISYLGKATYHSQYSSKTTGLQGKKSCKQDQITYKEKISDCHKTLNTTFYARGQ